MSQAKTVLIQGGYEPKLYKDGVWLPCKQFEEESVTNPSHDGDSSHNISNEENSVLATEGTNVTSGGDLDLSQENEESLDLDETILNPRLKTKQKLI